jgi:hypothetical protein
MTMLKIKVLKELGYDIAASNFANTTTSHRNTLTCAQEGYGQQTGDINSTPESFTLVLDLESPQVLGNNLSKTPCILQHLSINQPLSVRANSRNSAPELKYSAFQVNPVLIKRHNSIKHTTILAALPSEANWVHIANFVLLQKELIPAIAVTMTLILNLIFSHSSPDTRSLHEERFLLKPVILSIAGDTFKHYQRSAHIGIFLFTDPTIASHNDFHPEILTRLFTNVQARSATANLMGIEGVFIKRDPSKSGVTVDPLLIPRRLLKTPLFWLSFADLPPYITELHLHVILVAAFDIRDTTGIFLDHSNVNAPQRPSSFLKTPLMIVTFRAADNMKRLMCSIPAFNDVLDHLAHGSSPSPNPSRASIAIQHGARGPSSDTLPLPPTFLTRAALDALAIQQDFPIDTHGRHHSTKRSHEVHHTDPPDLSSTERLKALNLLHYHATHDPTTETMTSILQVLASIPSPLPQHTDLITQWINTITHSEYFRMVDTRLWTPIASSTSTDTSETVTMEEGDITAA